MVYGAGRAFPVVLPSGAALTLRPETAGVMFQISAECGVYTHPSSLFQMSSLGDKGTLCSCAVVCVCVIVSYTCAHVVFLRSSDLHMCMIVVHHLDGITSYQAVRPSHVSKLVTYTNQSLGDPSLAAYCPSWDSDQSSPSQQAENVYMIFLWMLLC